MTESSDRAGDTEPVDPSRLSSEQVAEAVAIIRRVLDALPPEAGTTESGDPITLATEDAALRERLELACALLDAARVLGRLRCTRHPQRHVAQPTGGRLI